MDNQPRLFVLDWFSIYQMKSKLPKYADNWEQLDTAENTEKYSFSLEDVEETKSQIRAFYDDDDERKLLFVHKPFVDLTCQHGFVLIKDPVILERVELQDFLLLGQKIYKLEIWRNCVIEVTEEKLAPNQLADRHIYYYNGIPDVVTLVIKYGDQILNGTSEHEKVAQLFVVFNSVSPHDSPIPELISERGRRRLNSDEFSRLFSRGRGRNGNATLEWVKFKTPIISDMRIRNLRLELKNGSSIILARRVDLQFFEQFQQIQPSASFIASNLENSENFFTETPIDINCVPGTSKQLDIEEIRAEEREETLEQCNNGLNANLREPLEKEPENVQEPESATKEQQANLEIDTLLEKEAELVVVSHAPIPDPEVSFHHEDVEKRDKTVDFGSMTSRLLSRDHKASSTTDDESKVTSKRNQQTKKVKRGIESSLKGRVEGGLRGSTTIFQAQQARDRAAKKNASSKISKLLQPSRSCGTEEEESFEMVSRINGYCVSVKKEEEIEEDDYEQENSIRVKHEVDLNSSAESFRNISM